MRRRLALMATLLVGLAGGCANWTVKSEASATAPFGQYRTFAWAAPAGGPMIDPLVEERIRAGVTRDLGQRGIEPARPGQAPDFLVDYRMETGPMYQTIVQPQLFAAPSASGATYIPPLPVAQTYTYNTAQVTLSFLDARSGRMFWHGLAAYATDRPAEAVPRKAEQAVSKMLRRYPAPAVASASRPSG